MCKNEGKGYFEIGIGPGLLEVAEKERYKKDHCYRVCFRRKVDKIKRADEERDEGRDGSGSISFIRVHRPV